MCGIIGYRGRQNATQLVVAGLKQLEYRGYDSWGIVYRDEEDGSFVTSKQIGKISEITVDFPASGLALGHTRWATHGGVNRVNSHPHFSNDASVILVHNGIVENFQELREELKQKKYTFNTETDTEVIANLIQEYEKSYDFVGAVRQAFLRLSGRNAIVVLDRQLGIMVAVRGGSPLIVGVAPDGYFLASDIPAFLSSTNEVMYLDDGQMVVVNDDLHFFDVKDQLPISKRKITINWQVDAADKGDYAHFMIKEIMEQKETIRRAINQDDAEIVKIAEKIQGAVGTYAVACGTAYHMSLLGVYLFATIAGKHINFSYASEFNNFEKFLRPDSLLLVTSQSGETVDVVGAMEVAHRRGSQVISLVNAIGSTIARTADYNFYINAGPEKAVASTKASTSQLALFMLLAYAAAGQLDDGKKVLKDAASAINDLLNPRYEERIARLAEMIYQFNDLYVIGRGVSYPVALEIALKIKEISYIHAEGMAGGELKHGTIALIGKNTPVVVLVPNDKKKQEILSNAMEIKARGGYIIGIGVENNDIFDSFLRVPDVGEAAPLALLIPGQILAYHLALLRQVDPDKPRNLAKSVTVK